MSATGAGGPNATFRGAIVALEAQTGELLATATDMRAAVGLLTTVRPTVWLAVPRIWEKLKDAIEAMRAAAPDPAQVSDEAVRTTLGLDAAELLVSGAAPIGAQCPRVLPGAREVEICEGYGLTESTGVGAVNVPGETRIGTAVAHPEEIEIELAEDGEILIRGGIVMAGYRGEPESTPRGSTRRGGCTPATSAGSTTTATSRSSTVRRS